MGFTVLPEMLETVSRIYARSHEQAMDWSLVLMSQGIESVIERGADGSWCLQVSPGHSEQAFQALRLYRIENRGWPWQREVLRPGIVFDWGSIAWVLTLIFMHWLDARAGLRAAGMMDSAKVSSGEWWRLFTAVWLHGDIGHLASNCASGLVLLGLAMGRYGTGLALLLAYLAGGLGNVAGWMAEPHRSLGASGMVMGALGLLTVQSLALLPRASRLTRYMVSGSLAGVMLFVLMGLSPGTDVLAHLGGFVGGVLLGAASSRWHRLSTNGLVQIVAGLLFVLLTLVPWWLAIRQLPVSSG